uniref:RING-type E3 ubiquitin transferase n=1 Tax=Lepisosteus oculatus TaxID=7918 RepID=W5LW03_LEPOC
MAQSKLTSELQCPVCLGLFADPVTLPCGHNVCRGCLESYLATARETHLCPECRAPIPRRDFRTNWALRNMADRARQEEEKRDREPPRCPEHGEKLRLFCETDGTLICLVCRDSRSHRGHGFKPVQEAAQEFRESLLAAQKAVKEDV